MWPAKWQALSTMPTPTSTSSSQTCARASRPSVFSATDCNSKCNHSLPLVLQGLQAQLPKASQAAVVTLRLGRMIASRGNSPKTSTQRCFWTIGIWAVWRHKTLLTALSNGLQLCALWRACSNCRKLETIFQMEICEFLWGGRLCNFLLSQFVCFHPCREASIAGATIVETFYPIFFGS